MIDTGMNRLGLRPTEIDALDGLAIDTLHSHLACADEDMRSTRCSSSASARSRLGRSGASATASPIAPGICLGRDYSFDLVRPGPVALRRHSAARGRRQIRQVARVEAQIVQRRTIPQGESCGYGATFVAREDTEAAILNIGYADGYLRGFSSRGSAFAGEYALPVLGRVSMDLIAVGVRRGAGPQGRRLGRDRLRPAFGVEAVRPFAVRAVDDARLRASSGAGFSPLLGRRRLRLVAAEVDHRAAPAFGQPRLAGVAAVQDQPVVRVAAEGLRARSSRASPRPRRPSCPARGRCGCRRGRRACRPRTSPRRRRC